MPLHLHFQFVHIQMQPVNERKINKTAPALLLINTQIPLQLHSNLMAQFDTKNFRFLNLLIN